MIIVTGGAGLIGSAIIWSLNQLGRKDILAVDNLGTGPKWKNLVSLGIADYLEKDDFMKMITENRSFSIGGSAACKVDAIFHLGACSATTEKDATYLVKNNFEYTKQVALFAMKNNARFIYASSAATYGDGIKGFNDDDSRLSELRPMNMYGYSKHLFDLWARDQGILDKIAGMKYFNVFGPNEYHKGEMRSLVLKAYEQIVSSGGIKLFKSHRSEYADGEQLRDFIYVKDAAAMTIKFMSNHQANGVFNIGGGEASSWNRLARAIFTALGKPEQIEYIDMPESIRETYQYHTCADTAKVKQAGCWQASTLLEKSVAEYVTEYLVPNRHLGGSIVGVARFKWLGDDMRYVYFVIGIVVATLVTIFAIQNAQVVQIKYISAQFEGQLVVFLLGFFAAGALVMYLFTVPIRIKSALEISSLKKSLLMQPSKMVVIYPKFKEVKNMPYVNIRITREGATAEQKAALIKGATQLLVDVLGKNPATTVVVIDEVDTDNWGIGGESITNRRAQGR